MGRGPKRGDLPRQAEHSLLPPRFLIFFTASFLYFSPAGPSMWDVVPGKLNLFFTASLLFFPAGPNMWDVAVFFCFCQEPRFFFGTCPSGAVDLGGGIGD